MFRILQKIIGVKQLSVIAKINVETIQDICYSDKFGFFFTSNQCLGLLKNSGELQYPILGRVGETGEAIGFRDTSLMNNPSAIGFCELSELIFIVEKYGKAIRVIHIKDNYTSYWHLPQEISVEISKNIPRDYAGSYTSLGISPHDIAWTNSMTNMIFVYKPGYSLRILGGDKEGYSISNKDGSYRFNNINGLLIHKYKLHISDTKNNCIRRINLAENSNEHNVLIGNPLKKDISPGKVIEINDNIAFINDKKSVCLFNGRDYSKILASDNIVSIANGPQNRLTILEKME